MLCLVEMKKCHKEWNKITSFGHSRVIMTCSGETVARQKCLIYLYSNWNQCDQYTLCVQADRSLTIEKQVVDNWEWLSLPPLLHTVKQNVLLQHYFERYCIQTLQLGTICHSFLLLAHMSD